MRLFIFIASLLFSVTIFAQIVDLGQPKSWSAQNAEEISFENIPAIDLQSVILTDSERDLQRDVPYRVGLPISVDYSLDNAGKWTVLNNQDRIWRLGIKAQDALQLSVVFDEFFLAEGAFLHLYNEDRSDLLGAYTAAENSKEEQLGTWFVKGDKILIELYEPQEVIGKSKLHIHKIIHAYRFAHEHQNNTMQKNLNDSGDCNHDVDCPIGADWETYRDNNKNAVAFINLNNGYVCSGALINNTAQDYTPYFLTANHCYDGSNPAVWSLRFKWISPDPVCATTQNSTQGPTNMVMSGTSLRANSTATDFCLVELNNTPPTAWNLTWAGWDKTDDYPDFVVGIHHPSADIMKICRDDSGVIKASNGGAQTWEITAAGFGWELGVTEGGSSGSPLFDENGRVIGQLYGGSAACNGTNDNNQKDFYGRLGISWNNGTNSSQRLKEWLDPINTDPDFIDSYSASANVEESFEEQFDIYPNPNNGTLHIQRSFYSGEVNYELLNILGQTLMNGKLIGQHDILDLNSVKDGLLFLKLSSTNSQNQIVKKVLLSK